MARTDSTAVQSLLGGDYDGSTDLDQFITSANIVTDRIATCASDKGVALSTAELTQIELYLAAHFYVHNDRRAKSKTTGKASITYEGETGKNFESTSYGQDAMALDWSGCLHSLSSKKRASGAWLGKAPSDQTPYTSRD